MTRAAIMTLSTTLLTATMLAQGTPPTDPALSPTEVKIVNRKIAALHSAGDRKVAAKWSNAKKVAEVLCRPTATAYWKRKAPGTDRVFLGTSAPETLTLESDRRLTGSGQYRTTDGWTDFRFTCDLDPATGAVTAFHASPAASPAP